MGDLKWLSASKLGTAMRCPRQFYYRYVERMPELSLGVFFSGRVVHSCIERALKLVLGGAALPSAKDMDDWYLASWEEEKGREEDRDTFLAWNWGDDSEKLAHVECRGLVALARKEVLPVIQPILVEHNFHMDLDVDGSGPFRIYGVIDLLEKRDGSKLLTDWKTAKKVSQNARTLDIQFMCYGAFLHEFYGDELVDPGTSATRARKVFLIRGKKPRVEQVEYRILQEHRDFFTTVAGAAWKMVLGGGYVPNTSGWWCNPDWCSFYGECRGGF